MPYPFYDVTRTIAPSTPKEYWQRTTQKLVDRQLQNASTFLQIEKYNPTTGLYVTKNTRVVKISSAKPSGQSSTATNNTDDYREIIFDSTEEVLKVGDRYRFENYVWLTMATDTVNQSTYSCVVRRCNNFFKWYDENGHYNNESIVILDKLDDNGNSYDRSIVLANARITIVAQSTNNVKGIKINQRFLFGGQAFKVEAIKNFTTEGLITFDLFKDQISATDDVSNNVADGLSYVYTLNITQADFQQTVGYTSTLNAEVRLNGTIVPYTVNWTSSNPLIGTINPSGVINLLALGTVTFSASISEQSTITDSITITVVAIPTIASQIVISPQVTKILQGREQIYTVYQYTNGVQDADTFTVTASGAPTSDYELTILSGNSFKVKNINKSTALVVNCVNDVNSDSETITIELGGLW